MMDKEFRERFLDAIEEIIECEWKAKVAMNKAKSVHERMIELYKELNATEKEETK